MKQSRLIVELDSMFRVIVINNYGKLISDYVYKEINGFSDNVYTTLKSLDIKEMSVIVKPIYYTKPVSNGFQLSKNRYVSQEDIRAIEIIANSLKLTKVRIIDKYASIADVLQEHIIIDYYKEVFTISYLINGTVKTIVSNNANINKYCKTVAKQTGVKSVKLFSESLLDLNKGIDLISREEVVESEEVVVANNKHSVSNEEYVASLIDEDLDEALNNAIQDVSPMRKQKQKKENSSGEVVIHITKPVAILAGISALVLILTFGLSVLTYKSVISRYHTYATKEEMKKLSQDLVDNLETVKNYDTIATAGSKSEIVKTLEQETGYKISKIEIFPSIVRFYIDFSKETDVLAELDNLNKYYSIDSYNIFTKQDDAGNEIQVFSGEILLK